MNERIEAIKARLAKATPAPWAPAIFDPTMDPVALFRENLSYGSGDVHSVIAPEHPKSNPPAHYVTTAITGNGPTSEANRDFIVNCPEDIVYLINVVDGLLSKKPVAIGHGPLSDSEIEKLYADGQGATEFARKVEAAVLGKAGEQIEKLKAELSHYETEEEIAEVLR